MKDKDKNRGRRSDEDEHSTSSLDSAVGPGSHESQRRRRSVGTAPRNLIAVNLNVTISTISPTVRVALET